METQEWMNDSFTPIHKFNRSFTTTLSGQGALLGARGKWVNVPHSACWTVRYYMLDLGVYMLDSGARPPCF